MGGGKLIPKYWVLHILCFITCWVSWLCFTLFKGGNQVLCVPYSLFCRSFLLCPPYTNCANVGEETLKSRGASLTYSFTLVWFSWYLGFSIVEKGDETLSSVTLSSLEVCYGHKKDGIEELWGCTRYLSPFSIQKEKQAAKLSRHKQGKIYLLRNGNSICTVLCGSRATVLIRFLPAFYGQERCSQDTKWWMSQG